MIRNLFKISELSLLMLILLVSCNNQPKVISPVEVPNLDSLKTYVDKAVKTDNPKDQYFAAKYYLQQYSSSDSTKAIDLLIKSANQKYPFAAEELGEIYSEDSTKSYYNIKKAVDFYKIGVKYGSDRSMTGLANLYINGQGVNRDYQKALQLYSAATVGLLKLAENGDASAQHRLGTNLADGVGIQQNHKEGFKWIKKSAEQGFVPAYFSMGVYYQNGYGGIEKNPKEAFNYFLSGAEKGNRSAMLEVGNCYSQGFGVENDLKKAFEYYLKSAELGHEDAMFNVGLWYQNGTGTEKNYKEAFNWYKKCADRGNTSAMNNIGSMYEHGTGVAKDEKEAFKWFKKAADAGSAFSQRVVGDFYYKGDGVESDKSKAFEYFLKSANGGDKTGMNRVGRCYLFGDGVPQDENLAHYWITKSE